MIKIWRQGLLVKKFVQEVFPLVDLELENWVKELGDCNCKELKEQALASIETKRFHALGGSIYALYPGVDTKVFVKFVVALQTISDYLDNLCDRAGVYDEQAFRQLHRAMTAALDPEVDPEQDFYKYYPYKDDGGYLASLVGTCQKVIDSHFPSYEKVKEPILHLAKLYIDLQSLKHLSRDIREEKLLNWADKYSQTQLSPWEFAAATGSTLGMFMLGVGASQKDLTDEQVEKIMEAYFPWITGLHILLDYFIDQEEDRIGGDLNFVFYYSDASQCQNRLSHFLGEAIKQTKALPQPLFHLTVVEGLLAMYLSDPKAFRHGHGEISQSLIKTGGLKLVVLQRICLGLRRKGKL